MIALAWFAYVYCYKGRGDSQEVSPSPVASGTS
jgi:hypothetical protein